MSNIKPNDNFLPQDGQYNDLIVYHKSECLCDITNFFCNHFLDANKDRTVDQMLQAARSGKQNIVEGTAASATSKETEIKLLNVAKASHQELLEDYKDYLKHHNLPQWQKGSVEYEKIRKFCREHDDRDDYNKILPNHSDTTIANIAITLICQLDYLLRNLIEYHKQEFLEHGGIKEEMARGRRAYRLQHPQTTDIQTSQWERAQQLNQWEERLKKKQQELNILAKKLQAIIDANNIGRK